jgi:hypothetical protein
VSRQPDAALGALTFALVEAGRLDEARKYPIEMMALVPRRRTNAAGNILNF